VFLCVRAFGARAGWEQGGVSVARHLVRAHGYICLVVDSLQLGEIAATHHGTYNLGRWLVAFAGLYAGRVEAWNGVRGIDYLVSGRIVDPERIAVTGISGGGAATFWVAAADERVKVAVPVSGMADLESYVSNRVIQRHCDCMFLYNTFPLAVDSDRGAGGAAADAVCEQRQRPHLSDGCERADRGRGWSGCIACSGAGDRVDAVVSVGGHAYRKDIRQAAYRFINGHLKGDARPITDSEVDIVSEGREPGPYPIAPERLRVFPTDRALPRDQLNTKIDEHFVALAKVALPKAGEFESWKKSLVAELKRVSFGYFPEKIPAAKQLSSGMESETGIEFRLRPSRREIIGIGPGGKADAKTQRSEVGRQGPILLAVLNRKMKPGRRRTGSRRSHSR